MKLLSTVIVAAIVLTACAAPQSAQRAAYAMDGGVMTTSGPVTGTSQNVMIAYRGIPYATAARWALPQNPAPWTDVLNADEFGPSCPQTVPEGQSWPMSEECLFINIFSPKGAKALPVLVNFHGGGFIAGNGNLDPAPVVENGIVVVSLNYRLGYAGFYNDGDPSTENNLGQADMVAGLKWVQDNIAAFGGDPDDVTISGHSAGGMAVQLMMITPRAYPYFDRAIAMAGYSTWPMPGENEASPQFTTRTPIEDMVAALPHYHLPYTGGALLPEQPIDLFAQGRHATVPYLSGGTSLDGAGVIFGAGYTVERYLALWSVTGYTRGLSQACRAAIGCGIPMRYYGITRAYEEDFAVSDRLASMRIYGDHRYLHASRATVTAMDDAGQAAFLYYYDSPASEQPGSYHGDEAKLIFSETPSAFQSYIIRFIKSGSPNNDSKDEWPAYDGKHWMVFDNSGPYAQSDVKKEQLDTIVTFAPRREDIIAQN